MTYSETPIFPAKMLAGQANIASASNASVALVTAAVAFPGIVTGPIIVTQKGTAARALRLERKNGSTVTVLGRIPSTGTAQWAQFNFLSSTYMAGMDDTNPSIRLFPGDVLQVTPEDTNAAAIDVDALNAMSYEYPN